MKTGDQKSGIMNRRAGFTLVEVLLAVSISVMVFFAMGMLLTKCFSLWKDATAHWRLAQYGRISRERILSGAFTNPVSGLLSATNAAIYNGGAWDYVEYRTMDSTGVVYQVYGWKAASEQELWIGRSPGSPQWAYGQGVAFYPSNAAPPVKVDSFSASVSNNIVVMSYRLRMSAAGKTFTQPQTISAWLVNKR
jgi:prepilin-type N-terminal cleavage/methylation domain-containing protein